ncbi:uncharacterized protein LOC119575851 [Penaeus monodon]|uniref:uncharacterized protein LOC119575851 n=1 Tax=Penaeus monodon TaxID=6687 RepID=UPI0018A7A692|nr:uncharacterized protein LOC119575851 [Penaeus monodon]
MNNNPFKVTRHINCVTEDNLDPQPRDIKRSGHIIHPNVLKMQNDYDTHPARPQEDSALHCGLETEAYSLNVCLCAWIYHRLFTHADTGLWKYAKYKLEIYLDRRYKDNIANGDEAKMHSRLFILTLATVTLFLRQGVDSYTDKVVDITELVVPENPRIGEDVTLICRFRLEGHGHRLYTVNWWRGRDQFYTYKGNNADPKHSYIFEGIHVATNESTDQSVVLKNVSEITSGIFKCEVMGEGPSFRTAVKSKVMNVIVPPKQVEITSYLHPDTTLYRIGQMVQLNCTATGAKPKAHITWKINGRPVSKKKKKKKKKNPIYK